MTATPITDVVARAEAAVGKRFTPRGKGVRDVTEHVVRDWAWGLDETNPVFSDPQAARAAGYPSLRVPPSFLIVVARGPSYEMYPFGAEVASLHAASEFDFRRELQVGDCITPEAWVTDAKERMSDRLGPIGIVRTMNEFRDRNGEIVGSHHHTAMLYSVGEATRIRDSADGNAASTIASVALGAETRPASGKSPFQLQTGDEIDRLTIGPIRIDQNARYRFAGGVPEPGPDPAAYHYDPWAAEKRGLKGVIDVGLWRTALFTQFALTWGPRVRVAGVTSRYSGMVYRGDLLHFCGRIAAKRTTGSRTELELEIRNEKEGPDVRETVTTGTLKVTSEP